MSKIFQDEARANFREYLKLVRLPAPPSKGLKTTFNFLESIAPAIEAASSRFVRLELPRDFDKHEVLKEWLATSGYSASFTDLEITIQW